MANEHNLIPNKKRSPSEVRENGRKGGIKSGEKRREKRDLRERMKILMEQAADPRVANAMSKTGVPITDNTDVLMAGIMKGVIKGDTKAINLMVELSGENMKEEHRKEMHALEKKAKQLEAERAEMENELYRMRLNAIKGIDQEEAPDDGFLDALKGTAEEDWGDEVI